jgi:hypothetical protein
MQHPVCYSLQQSVEFSSIDFYAYTWCYFQHARLYFNRDFLCVLFREEKSIFQFQVQNLPVYVDQRKLVMTTYIFEHKSLYVLNNDYYYYLHHYFHLHHHYHHQSFKL